MDGLGGRGGPEPAELALVPNRPARINVAGNITDLVFFGQNVTASNTTNITAGGNIDSLPVPSRGAVFQVPAINVPSIAPILQATGSGLLNIVGGGSLTLHSPAGGPRLAIRDPANSHFLR